VRTSSEPSAVALSPRVEASSLEMGGRPMIPQALALRMTLIARRRIVFPPRPRHSQYKASGVSVVASFGQDPRFALLVLSVPNIMTITTNADDFE